MNRATKRLLAKQEAAAEKTRAEAMQRKQAAGQAARVARASGEKREGRIRRFRRFLKEVRVELKKVAWPTRAEVFTYTVVVLVSVLFVTLFVFALDFAFANGLLNLFKS